MVQYYLGSLMKYMLKNCVSRATFSYQRVFLLQKAAIGHITGGR